MVRTAGCGHPLSAKKKKQLKNQFAVGVCQLLQRLFAAMSEILAPFRSARQLAKGNPVFFWFYALTFQNIVQQGYIEPVIDVAGGGHFPFLINEKFFTKAVNGQLTC